MTPLETKSSKPKLSIILLTPDNYETIRKVIQCYKAQTVVNTVELVIAAPKGSAVTLLPGELQPFHSYQVVEVESNKNSSILKAAAIVAANADVIVFGEDHSYPFANWAETLIKRHGEHWVAVGPRIEVPNSKRPISWTQAYMEYGPWLGKDDGGKSDYIPGHNSSFKRQALVAYGDKLADLLQSEYILFQDLRRSGKQLFFEPEAVTQHLNFEKIFPCLRVSYFAGRQFAAWRTNNWNWSSKLTYILGAPLIPMVRMVRIIQMMRRNRMPASISPSLFGLLLINLIADGFGQLMGYSFGLGNATAELYPFEFHRTNHLIDKGVLDSICP